MDVFGNIQAKPLDSSTAISPKYQANKEFSLYHEDFEKQIGTAEVAPYAGMLGQEFIDLELADKILEEPDSEIYLAIEQAEAAINRFYAENFPSMASDTATELGLVEKAENLLQENRQEQNPGMYQF